MPTYRFRKMFFICENKKIISPEVHMTYAYQYRKHAKYAFDRKDKEVKMWDANKPPTIHSVEAFYLVPEKLYDEILKKFVEGDGK